MPALMILLTFLSNSYFVYLSIPFIGFKSYSTLKSIKLHRFFTLSTTLVLVAFGYSIYYTVTKGGGFGPNYSRFELVTSILAISYGALIKDRINRSVTNNFLIAFAVLFLIQISGTVVFVRTLFYIVPFILIFFIFRWKNRNSRKGYYHLILSLIITFLLIKFFATTFTLILTALYGTIIYLIISSKRTWLIKKSLGFTPIIILMAILAFSINSQINHSEVEGEIIEMKNINTTSGLIERGRLKLLKDRAPLWEGAFTQITSYPSLLPSDNIHNITISGLKDLEWEHHSHNVYLELIRKTGILLGGITSVLLFLGIVYSRKGVLSKKLLNYELLFLCVSLGVVIVGSFTGIYVLLGNFALIPLAILGFTYSVKYRIE